MTLIIKGILLVFILSAVFLAAGDLFLRFVGWKRTPASAYAWGFVFVLAVFQLLAYPMFRLGASFRLLFWSFSAVLALILILAIVSIAKHRDLKCYSGTLREFGSGAKKYPFLTLVLVGVVLFCFFMSLGFYYSSSDDGYYITRSMEAITQNRLDVSETMAWQGRVGNGRADVKDCSTFVFFCAFLSYASGIQATILCKTFFLVNLLLAHFAAVLAAADALLEKRENLFRKKSVFMILYMVFQILAVKECSAGTWMTGYLWEGKAVLIAVVFPLLLSSCLTLYRRIDRFAFREWLPVLAVMLAGVELSVIGVFLPVILYFSFGAAILIAGGFRSWKRLWKPVLVTVIPVAIFAGLSYLAVAGGTDLLDRGTISSGAGAVQGSSPAALLDSWMGCFWQAADFWQFVLYAAAAVYALVRGSKAQRVLLVLAPVILLLTFLNPLLSDLVSKYVTTPIVYWRLFWLFPIYLLPAAVLTDVFDRLTEGSLEKGLAGVLLTLCVLGGFELFRYSVTSMEYSVLPFAKNVGKLINVRPELRSNIYNLNPTSLAISEAIETDWAENRQPETADGEETASRPNVLFCFNRPFELRLISNEIALASLVRNNEEAKEPLGDTGMITSEFISAYSRIDDPAFLREGIDILAADYVVFDGSSVLSGEELNSAGLVHVAAIWDMMDIWRVERR